MKPVLKYAYVFLSVVSANYAFAQSGSVPAVNSTLNRQSMDSQMERQTPFAMWSSWSNANDKKSVNNPEYTFLVTMLNGTKREVSSRIYVDAYAHKSYLLFVDKSLAKTDTNREQVIYPEQTIEIARKLTSTKKQTDPIPAARFYTGIAKDSCWMFKVISGTINVYSFLSEEEGKTFNAKSIVAIQLKNGPIVEYNEQNLMAMVGDDPDVIEDIQWRNYLRAIKRFNRNNSSAK